MPKGLTPSSEQIVVSFSLSESVIGTLASERIDLQLNALDSEVFVVTGVKMDLEPADLRATGGINRAQTFASISKQDVSTSAVGIGLANPSVIATAQTTVQAVDTPNNAMAAALIENSVDTPSQLEYIDVIATPDFFVNVRGVDNTSLKTVEGKLYGYRAKASSAVYASLVQSELLSQ
jgi:hypothetical protein